MLILSYRECGDGDNAQSRDSQNTCISDIHMPEKQKHGLMMITGPVIQKLKWISSCHFCQKAAALKPAS